MSDQPGVLAVLARLEHGQAAITTAVASLGTDVSSLGTDMMN